MGPNIEAVININAQPWIQAEPSFLRHMHLLDNFFWYFLLCHFVFGRGRNLHFVQSSLSCAFGHRFFRPVFSIYWMLFQLLNNFMLAGVYLICLGSCTRYENRLRIAYWAYSAIVWRRLIRMLVHNGVCILIEDITISYTVIFVRRDWLPVTTPQTSASRALWVTLLMCMGRCTVGETHQQLANKEVSAMHACLALPCAHSKNCIPLEHPPRTWLEFNPTSQTLVVEMKIRPWVQYLWWDM